jgi:DNA mismatch endonuclease (patch repair protein)
MTDVYDKATRSRVMARVKSKDTGPEQTVRKALTQLGARYRLHRKDLPGSPDIVLPGRRLAIFVHGCFWHGHDCPRGDRQPKTNTDYWQAKIGRNKARDVEHLAALRARNWQVLTVWECEIKERGLLARLAKFLGGRTTGP